MFAERSPLAGRVGGRWFSLLCLLSRCSQGWAAWGFPSCPGVKATSLSFPSVGPVSAGNSGRAPVSPGQEQDTLGVQGEFTSKVPGC